MLVGSAIKGRKNIILYNAYPVSAVIAWIVDMGGLPVFKFFPVH